MIRPRRPLAWVAAALSLAFAALCGAALLADGYHRHAAELELLGAHNGRALAAHRQASVLAGWRATTHQKYAWSLARRGQWPQAQREIKAALRLNPADAYLWTEYAQLLAWEGRFGAELERAVARAGQLAPAALPVQRALALLGLRQWYRADPALQALWLSSMEFVLRREPDEFLRVVTDSDRALDFCRLMAPSLPPGRWCAEWN